MLVMWVNCFDMVCLKRLWFFMFCLLLTSLFVLRVANRICVLACLCWLICLLMWVGCLRLLRCLLFTCSLTWVEVGLLVYFFRLLIVCFSVVCCINLLCLVVIV